jgi:hypothetical protein
MAEAAGTAAQILHPGLRLRQNRPSTVNSDFVLVIVINGEKRLDLVDQQHVGVVLAVRAFRRSPPLPSRALPVACRLSHFVQSPNSRFGAAESQTKTHPLYPVTNVAPEFATGRKGGRDIVQAWVALSDSTLAEALEMEIL